MHRFLFSILLHLTFVLPAVGDVSRNEKAFECRWTEHVIVIDGRPDDEAWRGAAEIDGFGQPWLTQPGTAPAGTRVKLLWDREWLYFMAEMQDRDVWADETRHDADTWNNDVFELFLKPSTEHTGYYEFQVNAAGTVFDSFLPDAAAFMSPESRKDGAFHVEAKVEIGGTLNQRDDTDKSWRVEGRLPWTDLLAAGGRPAPGEVWRLNLARYDYDIGRPEPELSSAAPLKELGFHRTDEFASLRFIGPESNAAPQWKNERLHGSPDGPSKFAAVRAWPKIPCRSVVSMAVVPDGEWLWLMDQTGGWEAPVTLWRFRPGGDGGDAEIVLTPGEVMYSIAFHPRFAENGFVYFGGNGKGAGGGNFSRIVRYSVRDARPDPASREMIIEWSSNGHNGAGIAFGADGMLFLTSGDGSSDADADNVGQDPRTLRAKVLRIDVDNPTTGRMYAVPPDNPFVSDSRFAPETWAYGLRNPWRISFDRASGQLWVGENGNDLWEMARLVRRGENYGWSRHEGSRVFLESRTTGPHPVTFPTIEHPHSEFRSLTGGFVYRGRALPNLTAAYIYGDFNSGRVRAAKHDGSRIEWDRELIDTPFALSFIGTGADGEIVLGDYGSPIYGVSVAGGLYRLEAAPPAPPSPPFPVLLSGTGLFSDTRGLVPASGVLSYDVAAPGWHDGAAGLHHLALPEGKPIECLTSKNWMPPNGTALAQTLALDGRHIETRVLLKQQNDWAGYTYLWNTMQSDASLAPKAGADITVAGAAWRVPSRAECLFCHSKQANFALTMHESQLNAGDQLARWETLGLLRSAAASYEREAASLQGHRLPKQAAAQRQPVVSPLLPRSASRLRYFVRTDDGSAAVDSRARSYLGANCAHCHTLYGGGNSAMDFDWLVPVGAMHALNQLPQHGELGIPGAHIILPGDPGRSVLIPRVSLRGPRQMPPVGTLRPDPAGVALLVEWIAALPRK